VNGAFLVGNLEAQRSDRLHYQGQIQPLLAATQAAARRGDPERILPISIVPIRAAEYLKAVADFGAPPGTTGAPVGSETGLRKGDRWMITTLDIRATPAGAVPAQCLALSVARPEIVVSPGALVFLRTAQEPTLLKLRRYAATYDNRALALLLPQSLHFVLLPRDHSSVPWRLQLTPHTDAVFDCHPSRELPLSTAHS
jgi:hypothetical protein